MHFSSQSQLHVCLCGLYLLWSKNHHELILPTSSLYIQTLIDHWVMPWITCTFITVNIHLSCYHKYSLEGQMCVNAQVKILPEIEDSEPERCEWPTIQESQKKRKKSNPIFIWKSKRVFIFIILHAHSCAQGFWSPTTIKNYEFV